MLGLGPPDYCYVVEADFEPGFKIGLVLKFPKAPSVYNFLRRNPVLPVLPTNILLPIRHSDSCISCGS